MPNQAPHASQWQKPFLKWAGGKFKIIDIILRELPPGARLIEPFVGSGAVFLNAQFPAYTLSDANPDLISLFTHLREEGEDFIAAANTLFVPENNHPERYYALREEFNTTTDSRRRAALFIYLNRHGFNGLCRYSVKGGFNVPFGRYRKTNLQVAEMRAFVAKTRSAATVEILRQDFRQAMAAAVPGDVVYCDPPYVPLNATAQFTDYTSDGFGPQDQQDLADLARTLQRRGIPVLISNHDTPWTRELYEPARILAFDVQRLISADAQNRAKAAELLAVFA